MGTKSRIRTTHPYGKPIPQYVIIDRDWFRKHQDELVQKYGPGYILIYHEQVLGTGKTWDEAVQEAESNLPLDIEEIYLMVERLGPSNLASSSENSRNWFQRHQFLLLFILLGLSALVILWVKNPISSVFIVDNESSARICGINIYVGAGRSNPPLRAHKASLPNGTSGILVYAGDEPPNAEPVATFKVKGKTVIVYYPGEREPGMVFEAETRSITLDDVELKIRGSQILEDKPYPQTISLPYGGTLDIEYPQVDPSESGEEPIAKLDRSKSKLIPIFFLKPGNYKSVFYGCWIAKGGGDYALTHTPDPYEFEAKFGQIVRLTIEDEPEE